MALPPPPDRPLAAKRVGQSVSRGVSGRVEPRRVQMAGVDGDAQALRRRAPLARRIEVPPRVRQTSSTNVAPR